MGNYQRFLTALVASLISLVLIGGTVLFFSEAVAAPSGQVATPTPNAARTTYVSLSALAFMPLHQETSYTKNATRQMLSLDTQSRNFSGGTNLFIAPLTLPDQMVLTGMTVFGEDFDEQGAVEVRLKRCDQAQSRCLNITSATSTGIFAMGRFETAQVALLNEGVDNSLYSYFLELELTALNNSGLRAVRVELVEAGSAPPPVANNVVENWELSGNVTNYLIPNTGLKQIRICTGDLSHLPNITHYPSLVVDGQSTRLSDNQCVTIWGRTIQLRRPVSAGDSAGTYEIIQ